LDKSDSIWAEQNPNLASPENIRSPAAVYVEKGFDY